MSRNSLVKFIRIRWYNLQELLLWIKKCTLASIVAFGMRSEGNSPKNGEPTVGLFFMTMLQHRGRIVKNFLSKNNVTTLQHLPAWLQLIVTCFLDWNQQWRDGAFVMLLTSLIMRRKSWKGFYKTASRNVSNTFTVAGRSVQGDYFEWNVT
jgi:hypothetical protein